MTEQILLNKTLASFESLTGYNGVIQSDHAYIHDGLAFTAIVDLGSISSATKVSFKTPSSSSGKYVHWRPLGIQTSANYVKTSLIEGDAYTGGVAVTPINRNRLSSNTSDMQSFVSGSTVTPTGTVIDLKGIGSTGNPSSRAGGGDSSAEELVLKQNTDYTLLIEPSGATNVTLELYWYEEPQGLS